MTSVRLSAAIVYVLAHVLAAVSVSIIRLQHTEYVDRL